MKAIPLTIISVAALLGMLLSSCSDSSNQTMRFFVGTYSTVDEPGIYSCEVDLKEKKMKVLSATFGIENASFLALSPNKKYLYAVSETDHYDATGSGGVYAYRVKPANLALREINSVGSAGANPCHVSIHPSGKVLFAANYTGGNVISVPINPDGSLRGTVQSVQHMGSGPVAGRQDKPHAHSANIDPSGNFLYAADLGIDQIMGYRVKVQNGDLSVLKEAGVSLAPGSGPRHLAFHPDHQTIFVVNELNSTVTICRMNPDTGSLDTLQSVRTIPDNFDGENYCAEIHVHPSGQFLYVSNRGHNSIAVFRVNQQSGSQTLLELIQFMPTFGDWPRNFALSPGGDYLMVANQNSNNLVMLAIDQQTGKLKDMGLMAKIPNPVCVVFYN